MTIRNRCSLRLLVEEFSEFVLGQYADTELSGFLELGPGFIAGNEIAGFFAHTAAHFSTSCDDHLRDFITWLSECASDYPDRSGDGGIARPLAVVVTDQVDAGNAQPLDQLSIYRLVEKLMNARADDFSHVRNALQFFDGCVHQRVDIRKVHRQRPRSAHSNVQNAEPENQPPKRLLLAAFDRLDQIRDAFLAHPLELRQLVGIDCVNVRDIAEYGAFDELGDERFAKTFDVHCPARGEMFDASTDLRGTL